MIKHIIAGLAVLVCGMSLAWADVGGVGKITAHDLGTLSVLPVSGTYSVSANLTATENDTTGDDDYFKFTLKNPATIVISSSSTIDTYGTLLDDNLNDKKNEIASNDDAFLQPNVRDFRIERVLSAGTYYVHIRPYAKNVVGAYTLTLLVSPPPQSLMRRVAHWPQQKLFLR